MGNAMHVENRLLQEKILASKLPEEVRTRKNLPCWRKILQNHNALKTCSGPPLAEQLLGLWHQVTLKIKARVRLRYPILTTYFHGVKGSAKDPCSFKNAEAEEP